MDVSFLLPTNRHFDHAYKVIDSINSIKTDKTYEICLYCTREPAPHPHVQWFRERPALMSGPISAFNDMIAVTTGDYLICLVDDHVVEPDVFKALEFIESDVFKDRRFKITTLSPGPNNFARIPIKGDTWCGGVMVDYDVEPFTTMRFPVVARGTVMQLLDGHIFHPAFRYHAGDLWLGYYLGMNGEPGIQCEDAHITEYANLRNSQYEQSDCRIYHQLVAQYRQGKKSYV